MSSITMRYHVDLERLTSFSNKEKPNLTNLILSYLTPHPPPFYPPSKQYLGRRLSLNTIRANTSYNDRKGVIIVFPSLSIYLPKQQNIPLLRFSTSTIGFLMDVPYLLLPISRAFVDA